MAVVYAAHTEACTLMLDERGVCEWAAPTGSGRVPDRIIGAQFVASLDVTVPGALVGEPKEGVPMLFAAVDENGRVSLVRTTNLVRFDDRREGSGVVRTGETPTAPAPKPSLRPSLEDLAPRGRTSSVPPRPPVGARTPSSYPPPARTTPPPGSDNNYAPPRVPRPPGAPAERAGRTAIPSTAHVGGAKRSTNVTLRRLVRKA